jgi:AcrR family transcriptional regulator
MAEFRAHGVSGASIARISEAAGLARSAFYFHFPTKIDALCELRDMFEESYANRIAEGGDLKEVLRSLVEGILEARAAIGDPALFGQMLALETDPSTSTTRPSRAVAALVRQFVAAAARGDLREGLDPEHAAHLCLRCIFGCLIGSARDERSCRRDLTTMASFFQQEPGRRRRP